MTVLTYACKAYGESCYQSKEYDPVYELAPEEYRKAVKESEAENRKRLDAHWLELPSYRCAHCDMFTRPRSRNVISDHLHEK